MVKPYEVDSGLEKTKDDLLKEINDGISKESFNKDDLPVVMATILAVSSVYEFFKMGSIISKQLAQLIDVQQRVR